jgi:hypothetical protein
MTRALAPALFFCAEHFSGNMASGLPQENALHF